MGRRLGLRDQKFQRTFLKEWREFRGLSQERLADRVSSTSATISRLENGRQPYQQALMEAIAGALNASVADLISRPPERDRETLLDIIKTLGKKERQQALRILGALQAADKVA